ncbi:MAG: hypothetical protein WC807_10805 [Hyphomicrobium sp.]|jgi:hypothetical protein
MLVRALNFAAFAVISAALASPSVAKCRMHDPDLSVAGITLLDNESAARVLGSGLELKGGEEDLPYAAFVSRDGKQALVVFSHYGAVLDEYAEVEVRAAGSEALVLKDLPVDVFKTARGVEMGLSADAIISLFGSCYKAREASENGEIIQYEIKREQMDPALLAHGQDAYFAEYEFASGKLVRFRFGFESP